MKDLARANLHQYQVFTNQSCDSLHSLLQPQLDTDLQKAPTDLQKPTNDLRKPDSDLQKLTYDLQKPEPAAETMPKSDSMFTWQSYSCSSRYSTLSSQYRDQAQDPGLNTEVTTSVHISRLELETKVREG